MIFDISLQRLGPGPQAVALSLGLLAAGCAKDVVLGEHVPQGSTTTWSTSSESNQSMATSTAARVTDDGEMSWEPPPSFTRDHWHDIEPDGGRSFDEREGGGPRWPPRPGETPPILEPGPAHSDSEFPFEPPEVDSTFDPRRTSEP